MLLSEPVRNSLRCRYDCGAAILIILHYVVGCTTSFDLASEKLSHVWVRLFFEKIKDFRRKDRTYSDSKPVKHLTTKPTVIICNGYSFLLKYMLINNIDSYWYRLWSKRENNKLKTEKLRKIRFLAIRFYAYSDGINWLALKKFSTLTTTLSGFEISNDPSLKVQNWLVSRLFVTIFHNWIVFLNYFKIDTISV